MFQYEMNQRFEGYKQVKKCIKILIWGGSCFLLFFFLFESLHPSQQFFSYVGMGLPGLNQY